LDYSTLKLFRPPPNHPHFQKENGGGWVGVAMLFAGPLAVVLRGLILNAPIIPIFAVVLSVTSALGMMIWRGLYLLLKR
jgi:hypothetical protein